MGGNTLRNQQSFQLLKSDTRYVTYGGSGTISLPANQYVPILIATVPRQEVLLLEKNPKISLKLYNTDGDQISDGCKIMIASKKTTQELPQEICVFKQYYDYSELSIADQSNVKFADATKFEMFNQGSFPEESQLIVLINSPVLDNVDWDNANSRIAIGRIGSNDLQRGEIG